MLQARWRARGLIACNLLALVLLAGVEPTSERSLEVRSSGRVTLVRGGLELAGDRPAYGYGSGAFQEEFAQRYLDVDEPAGSAISHSEPVTVAAEQGALGLVLYAALLGSGFAALPSARASPAKSFPSRSFTRSGPRPRSSGFSSSSIRRARRTSPGDSKATAGWRTPSATRSTPPSRSRT